MSAVLGIFTRDEAPHFGAIPRMLAAMQTRGQRSASRTGPNAAVAVARHPWELDDAFSGPVLVLEEGAQVIAADATLFYQNELRRRLRSCGTEIGGSTPSHLLLAAYRAWGEHCAERLEGDFAFVIWDRSARRVFCARDPGGKRPLFYANLGDTLLVASSLGAILTHPRCPDRLDETTVGAAAAGWLGSAGPETCYRSIRVLPAAHHLVWENGILRGPTRDWEPSAHLAGDNQSFDAAADELRELLGTAVSERLAPAGPTAVWMSGGWDSPSVFGAGQQVKRQQGGEQELVPVSISYPEGDPGREDELIGAIAEFWDTPVRWLSVDQIPLFARAAERVGERDEPFAHLYESWNRALARAGRSCGARVALDGNGGDQLFQLSDVFLADLFARGRWYALAREWRAKGGTGWENFFKWVIQPALPSAFFALSATSGRRRRLRSYLERPLPPWIRADFVRRSGLRQRERQHLPQPKLGHNAQAEMLWFLTCPFFARGFSIITAVALAEGVELRSPLYDRRLVEFALGRPREERSSGRETKRLLRRAMNGLLPPHVLAPRPFRTGVTSGYSHRQMRAHYPALFYNLFRSPLLLAEMGIVDPGALRRSVDAYLGGGDRSLRVALFYTLQTELWLRTRSGTRPRVRGEQPDRRESEVAA